MKITHGFRLLLDHDSKPGWRHSVIKAIRSFVPQPVPCQIIEPHYPRVGKAPSRMLKLLTGGEQSIYSRSAYVSQIALMEGTAPNAKNLTHRSPVAMVLALMRWSWGRTVTTPRFVLT